MEQTHQPVCRYGVVSVRNTKGMGKNDSKWQHGLWLGRRTQSDEHYVGLQGMVNRTRTVRRPPHRRS
eukprot:927951-Lingulodinium_polyedra.AAC.1